MKALRPQIGLPVLFGTLYFIQGICEPTDGLIAQPVQSLLKRWGHSAEQMATFAAVLTIPWSIKPLYGLVTDFMPLAGYRRRSYLVLAGLLTLATLTGLYLFPLPPGSGHLLLLVLLVPTVAVAFTDVVTDALMVESCQPLGLTGRVQAVQWAAMYAATFLVGLLGGYLSHSNQEYLGFLLAGLASIVTVALALGVVRETMMPQRMGGLGTAAGVLWRNARSPLVLGTGAFLFLLNFNPFSGTILYLHMTETLGMSEQFYGVTRSLDALVSIAACVAYGFFCRRVPMVWLLHLSIVLSIISTLLYWFMIGEHSALWVTAAVSFTYMTTGLIQLDLAAQACPVEDAGTVFALLMALSNLGVQLATWSSGQLHDPVISRWGPHVAFDAFVAIGAACTALSWFVVPYLQRHLVQPQGPIPSKAPGQ